MTTIKPAKTPKQPKSFTVNRSKWIHGGIIGTALAPDSELCNTKGMMCCLGFLGKQVRATGLRGMYVPERLDPPQALKFGSGLVHDLGPDTIGIRMMHTELCSKILSENDIRRRPLKVREKNLTRLFKKAGISVKFVGRSPTKRELEKNGK